MVQGGLLTTHPRSVHGGGEAPGGDPPLRQGAGKSSPGAPDLGSAAAAEQRRDCEKGFRPEGFGTRGIYMRRGVTRGGEGAPGAPLARPGVGPRRVAAWATPGSPLALLWLFAKLPVRCFFLYFSRNFLSTFNMGET